jgi:hypothetical protein
MNRALLSLTLFLFIFIAEPAGAQVIPVNGESSVVSASVAPAAEAAVSLAAQLPAPRPSPVLNFSAQRRRGSMVGYIDDPIVSSKIRVRFEMGLHNTVPDRAEFFYAKCGCYRDLPPSNAAYDPDAAGPGPGVVSDLNFQQFYVLAEYAATDRFSAFAELPIRWIQPQSADAFDNQSGMSDLRAGLKLGLAANEQMSLTAQVKAFLNSGDSRQGLGTGHSSIEPGLLYHRNLSERTAIATQLSVWIPFGGSNGVPTTVDGNFAGSILSYGIGPSFEAYSSEKLRFAPVVELVGWHVLKGYQTTDPSDASGTNIVNLKLGARATLGDGSSIYGGYGFALTDADWYDDIVRFEYRLSF